MTAERGKNFIAEVATATAIEMLAQIKARHVCIHEADIAVVLDVAKRSETSQVRIFERYEELLALTSRQAALAEANNVATDHRKTNDHTALRDEMIQFKKIFGELRMTYLQFLAKTF